MAYSLDSYFYIKGEKWNQLKKRAIAAVTRRLESNALLKLVETFRF